MKHLSEKDMEILNVLSQYQQGLFLKQIQKFAHIERKEYAFYYMKKLVSKGFVRKKDKLYFSAQNATELMLGVAQHITHHPRERPAGKHQRPHAEQVNFALFKTSNQRFQATLTALHIPYRASQAFPGQIDLVWKGLALRRTSTGKLLAYPKAGDAPFNIPWASLRETMAEDAACVIESFLSKTGLRCLRSSTGELLYQLGYGENAYPDNEIAQKDAGKGMVIYAYDKATGHKRIWGDGSLGQLMRELEFSGLDSEQAIKTWLQAVENKELDPYEDEMRTRRKLMDLEQIAEKTLGMITENASSQHFKDQQTSQLINELILSRGRLPERLRWKNG